MALTQISTNGIKDATIATADIADDAVTSAKIADDAITSALIADDAIDSEHIADGSIDTAHIAADQITGAKIADDAVGSEHIETLDANLDFADAVRARFGAGNDLEIYHTADSYSYIQDSFGNLRIDSDIIELRSKTGYEKYFKGTVNGAVELYYDNVKKFETTSAGVTVTGELDIADGEYLDFGNGGLKIRTNSNNAYITEATSGKLAIQGSNIELANSDGDETYIYCADDGAVDLYHNGTKRLETTSIGVTITGGDTGGSYIVGDMYWDNGTNAGRDVHWDQSDDIWNYKDDVKVTLGNGNDLQIYHDGTSSILKNTTGSLYVQNDSTRIVNAANSETIATFTANGSCELYYDNAKKLETTAGGVKVNGETLSVINTANAGDARLFLKAGETGTAYILFEADEGDNEADNWRMLVPNQGPLTIEYDEGNWEKSIECNRSGNVELYYDNAKKFETTSDGVTIPTSSSAQGLRISSTGDTYSEIRFDSNRSNANNHIGRIINYWNGTAVSYISMDTGSDTTNKDDGIIRFWTSDGSGNYERMRINSSGSLLIGTTSDGTGAGLDEGGFINSYGRCVMRRDDTMYIAKSIATGGYTAFEIRSAQTTVGSISFNSGGTSFNTSSDYRRKENIVNLTDGITRLKTLKPYRFNFKNEPDVTRDGFLAHEVTAVPEAVWGTKDAVEPKDDEEKDVKKDDPIYQQLDQSKLVPLLTAALQEAITKIETLETKVAALEAA